MNFLTKVEEKLNIAPYFFVVLTFVLMLFRVPFFDEAYAFLISQLPTNEIFELLKVEGHGAIWYLLLKIFSINSNFYPYPMLFLSWLISSVLIFVFWKKAPFNNLIKFLIIFSYPFFNYFSIYARPYGLNVLILFLLASLVKDIVKKPILFYFLIVLCANISAIGAIGAFAFFIFFLFEVKKIAKKDLFLSFFVYFLGAIFILIQFSNVQMPELRPEFMIQDFKNDLFNFISFGIYSFNDRNIFQILFSVFSSVLLYFGGFLLFKKDKRVFLFLFINYALLTFLFIKIYVGAFWHYFFYFVYFIVALWLCWDKFKDNKTFKIFLIILLLISLNSYSYSYFGRFDEIDTRTYKTMFKEINKEKYKKAKIFCLDWFCHFSPGLLPYLKKENIDVYDVNGFKRDSKNSMMLTARYRTQGFKGAEFIKHLDKNKDNYLITQHYIFSQGFYGTELNFVEDGFIYKDEKCKIFFEIKRFMPNIPFSIYKINLVEVYE